MRISDWSSDVCSSDLLAAETLIPAERGAARGQSGFDRLASSVARIWSAKTSRSAPICCGVAGASIRSYQDSPNARVSVLPTPAVIEQIGDRGGEIMIWASSEIGRAHV